MIKNPTDELRLKVRKKPKNRSPILNQSWRDLLFIHFPYDKEAIQATLPLGLYVDTFQEKAYLTITPFFVSDQKIPPFPSIPGFSSFLETNVRTYVFDENGLPGIWFYSLYANTFINTQLARIFFSLPYQLATIEAEKKEKKIHYSIIKNNLRNEFEYQGSGDIFKSEFQSLDFFLIERYVLFAESNGSIMTARVNHAPYPLEKVITHQYDTSIVELNGFKKGRNEQLIFHYSSGVDVDIYPLIPHKEEIFLTKNS